VTQLTEPVRIADRPPDPPGTPEPRGNVARLILTVLAVIALAILTNTTDVLIVIVAIIAMVMLHELGHFATAKWSGMKVTEYFLGFGPRLWSFKRGETEYGVKALPLGGYVKIVGMSNLEDVPPEDEPRTYRQQPFRKRLLVAVAGSAVHFILAAILLFAIFVGSGVQQPGSVQVQALSSWQAQEQSPASAAGIEPGDVIISINGHAVHNLDQVSAITSVSQGRKLTMVVRRDGRLKTLTVVPADGHLVRVDGVPAVPASKKDAGLIGVELGYPLQKVPPLQSVGRSVTEVGSIMKEAVVAVWDRFSPAGIANLFHQVTSQQAAKSAAASGSRPESIYGAVRTATQGVQAGWADFLLVRVEINVFIGLLNLFPMLPLDGGHVLVAVYERVRSRKGMPYHADVAKLSPVAYAFVALLAFVVLSALYLDITNPIPNPFK
jgi:membrane-associated protease RseP (regulator of RpoE activity)